MMETNDDAQMLNPQDVSKILGVHQKTVHAWLRSGKLGGVKISYRAWRIPRAALDHFIEENRNTRPSPGKNSRDEKSDPSPGPDKVQNDNETPLKTVNMKQYIRDIMGEQNDTLQK